MTLESSCGMSFSKAIRDLLKLHLKNAYAIGHTRLIKRISALLMLEEGLSIAKITELMAVSSSMVCSMCSSPDANGRCCQSATARRSVCTNTSNVGVLRGCSTRYPVSAILIHRKAVA